MAFNPFLAMDEHPVDIGSTDELNPFMLPDSEPVEFSADNPFAGSNPFADFGAPYEPPAGDTVPTNIFVADEPTGSQSLLFSSLVDQGNNENTSIFSNDIYHENQEIKNMDIVNETNFASDIPDIPPRPVPIETQNLIQSVTGQMDLASSHLLDRIPLTRTPSPVSVLDIHSSCPTPEGEMEDLPQEPLDVNRNKPMRPPPPPPARPAPPRPAPPPIPQAKKGNEDINLFAAAVAPVTVKPTKEDILNLYSVPRVEEKSVDFLSDDIMSDTAFAENAKFNDPTATDSDSIFADVVNVSKQSVTFYDDAVTTVNENVSSLPVETVEETMSIGNFEDNGLKNPFGLQEGNDQFHIPEQINDTFTNSSSVFDDDDSFHIKENQQIPITDTIITSPLNKPVDSAVNETAFVQETLRQPRQELMDTSTTANSSNSFDAFAARFDSAHQNDKSKTGAGVWGDDIAESGTDSGFEAEAFDPFLSMGAPPPPAASPRLQHQTSDDSNEDNFNLVIRPKDTDTDTGPVPVLAPPPRPQMPDVARINPFDKNDDQPMDYPQGENFENLRSDDGDGADETPPTPLFDEDISMPLEDFPRTTYTGPGWEMHLRQPNKKKITGQRFWKKVFVRVGMAGDNPVVQLYKTPEDKEPFQELPLQACYSVSEVGAQQFDQFGKIFTVKLQYVFYKERPGVRPGQVTKAERITNKLSQFAAYAIQGDYQGVKEFGSDLRKLGLPVEHAPQMSQLFKLGSLSYEDVKQFSCCIEEALFKLSAHRDRALTYKMEEVQITVVDELYVEQDAEGSILKQIARVRLFFLGFLSGMPDVEVGVNDLRRQGKEVVGRHDIIPVETEEWIRVEDTQFHACVQPEEFAQTQILRFKPPDACYLELMRFRVRPPKNRELPFQLKAIWCVNGNKVELRADILVPGFTSRKLGQIPCEDVSVRVPIPECWIYLFRVEKHFRYGSVKSAHRRTGKIKGIERFLGAVDTLQESLIEVTSGQAKYEHQHRAIVWRMPRLPKEGQGAYTTHNLVCRMALTSYDQVPQELAKFAFVEFTMPSTQVSHTTVRSVSLQNHDNDPPEKYVRYLARHEYIVGIERTSGQEMPVYSIVTKVEPSKPPPLPEVPEIPAQPSSDSDSD